jgi:uncharacterized protein YicC (UPF0701 family)
VIRSDIDDRIFKELITLNDIKADRDDLNVKADIISVLNKADQDEISRLEALINELNKTLEHQQKEFNDALAFLNTNSDKKIEAAAGWTLRQLKKEYRKVE